MPMIKMNKFLQRWLWFYSLVLALLSLTGLIPWLLASRMSGILLLFHITIGPFFLLAILVLAFFYPFAFYEKHALRELCFWVTIILALPLTLSIAITMFPVLHLQEQERMIAIHRYCALAVTIISLLFLVFTSRMRYFEEDEQPFNHE